MRSNFNCGDWCNCECLQALTSIYNKQFILLMCLHPHRFRYPDTTSSCLAHNIAFLQTLPHVAHNIALTKDLSTRQCPARTVPQTDYIYNNAFVVTSAVSLFKFLSVLDTRTTLENKRPVPHKPLSFIYDCQLSCSHPTTCTQGFGSFGRLELERFLSFPFPLPSTVGDIDTVCVLVVLTFHCLLRIPMLRM